ncbi:MAG TPA: antibiotic biosynthesis monooxygenase [Blastocatellia bacterium]|nr:antibiotic biosynthesis monooxygenase [Blastocatellia bacterium]
MPQHNQKMRRLYMTYDVDHSDQLPETNPAEMARRDFLAAIAMAVPDAGSSSWAGAQQKGEMNGKIGKIIAVSDKRDELIANIMDGIRDTPGCLSYIVAKDASSSDAIWISEARDSKASHEASLSLPSVKAAIAKNLPPNVRFGDSFVTVPAGGQGLRLPHRR